MSANEVSGHRWASAELPSSRAYLPALPREMAALRVDGPREGGRVVELGCGNGSVASVLAQRGWDVTGLDPLTEGIAQANAQYPALKLEEGGRLRGYPLRAGRPPTRAG